MEEKHALEYLSKFYASTVKKDLESITELMKRLGNPQDRLKIIHIAGTNGKGSTSAFISNGLIENGYKVGCFNSPYLVTPRENIRINNSYINKKDFLVYIRQTAKIALVMREEGYNPSYFEVMLGAAFTYFYMQHVDFVVLEVGLGGTYDSTNVIKHSLISVITKIGIDHTAILGDSLIGIANHKAGIIKSNGTVIMGHQEKEVTELFEKVCHTKNAELTTVDNWQLYNIEVTPTGTSFVYKNKTYNISLIGSHQAYNCAIAITVLNKLKRFGINLNEDKFKHAFKITRWEGRFEKIGDEPLFFIDGAHNLDGIKALSHTINALPKRYTVGIIGVLKDKQVTQMLDYIIPCFDTLIVTSPPTQRAVECLELGEKIKAYGKTVHIAEDIVSAKQKALEICHLYHDAQIIGFGSLYMIGELKK